MGHELGENNLILDIFFDKELCDFVRDISKNSPIGINEAITYMEYSNNYERDSFIVKKLSLVGMRFDRIMPIIKALNLP